MGHLAGGRVHAQGTELPHGAVGGVHVPAAVLFHLGGRDDVDGLLLRDPEDRAAVGGRAARAAPAGGQQLNGGLVGERELRQGLLRGREVPELRLGAAQPDPVRPRPVRRRVDQVKRHEPG
jgi:hypothetical protein